MTPNVRHGREPEAGEASWMSARWRVRRLVGIALATRESLTNHLGPAFGRDDPRAIGPWRIVANVLVVPALESSDPMLLFVLLETNDLSVHEQQGA